MLDLCTGTADLALAAMSGQRRAKRVIGVDFSAAMLRIGNEKVRKAGRRWRRTSISSAAMPRASRLRDATVDATTIGFGIRNVEQPGLACREIARVLRPGGTLVILEFSLPRSPALRNFYRWYFRRILPLIGRAHLEASERLQLPAGIRRGIPVA